ncbi:MAG: hypothetical protein WCQ32_00020 [bacterium]
MLLSKKPETKECIVEILAKGALDTTMLQVVVQEKKTITKQGFYKALRELIAEEVVVKNKQVVLLSTTWLSRMKNFVGSVDANYTAQIGGELLDLKEGDSMVFTFKSLLSLDLLWMHYFCILAKEHDESVLLYNGHNFWNLLRPDIENTLYEWLNEYKKDKTYYVIGHNTPLDKISNMYMKDEYGIQVAFENTPSLPENSHPVVFGDYVMNTVLDNTLVHAIDALYKKNTVWNDDVKKELEEIVSRLRRSKVVIERNKKKAEQIRKKLMKYFVFYK